MSIMRKKEICPGVILITNYEQFGDFGVYLEGDGKLLLLSEGEFDYVIDDIDEDEAYEFVDFCDTNPDAWEKYFPDEEFPDPFSGVNDRESFAEALKEYGILPQRAKVYCDLTAEKPLYQFIRDLIREMY